MPARWDPCIGVFVKNLECIEKRGTDFHLGANKWSEGGLSNDISGLDFIL